MNEPLSSIMRTDLITVSPDDTLRDVRQIFMRSKIHHIPVVDGDTLVGLLTTYDLFKLGKSREEYAEIPVSDVMTRRLATLEPHEKVGAAAEIFLENLFHAIPIVKDRRLVGIVTSFDVLKYSFTKAYPNHQLVAP